MQVASRTDKKARNEKILKDLLQWRKEEPSSSLQQLFKKVEEKYKDMTFTNAQNLYYTKLKPLIEAHDAENKEESPVQPNYIKETIQLNGIDVRIVDYENEIYVVSKDLLSSIGIGSYSTHLTAILTNENKALIPILSSHGYAKTLVIKMDTCLELLRIIGTEHKSSSIQRQAAINFNELRMYTIDMSIPNNGTTKTVEHITNTTSQANTLYKAGEMIRLKIKHVGLKSVIGETEDGRKTHGTVYISDVTDSYIKDLHDYFEEGQTITAKVKVYDELQKRLFLTTKDFIKPIIESIQKEDSQTTTTPNVTVTIKEEQDSNNSHEMTFSGENTPILPIVQEELVTSLSDDLPTLSIKAQDEFNAIVDMINNDARIGALSPDAKQKLIHLLNDNGLVKMISGIKDSAPEFKPDLGLLFLKEVEKKIKGECL